jgi:hypothetical protein
MKLGPNVEQSRIAGTAGTAGCAEGAGSTHAEPVRFATSPVGQRRQAVGWPGFMMKFGP